MPAIIRMDVVFPAPFGPEQPEQLAAGHVEVDAVHRGELAVALGEPGQPNHVILRTMASTASRCPAASTTIASSEPTPSPDPRQRLDQQAWPTPTAADRGPASDQRRRQAAQSPIAGPLPGGDQRAADPVAVRRVRARPRPPRGARTRPADRRRRSPPPRPPRAASRCGAAPRSASPPSVVQPGGSRHRRGARVASAGRTTASTACRARSPVTTRITRRRAPGNAGTSHGPLRGGRAGRAPGRGDGGPWRRAGRARRARSSAFARAGEVAGLVQRVAQVVAGTGAVRLELERALQMSGRLGDQSTAPQQAAELQVGGRVRRVQPQDAPQVGIRLRRTALRLGVEARRAGRGTRSGRARGAARR